MQMKVSCDCGNMKNAKKYQIKLKDDAGHENSTVD